MNCQVGTAAVGTGTPGSASNANQLPRSAWSHSRGMASASAGSGIPTNRITLRPLTSTQASQPTSSAGARDGAQATIAANNRAADPDADQERAAAKPAKNNQGSSRCTMIAAGRPAARAVRKVGESAHSTAATARIEPRWVNRVAAIHAPIAASGSANRYSRTMTNDGDQKVRVPRIASTAANGSAAPVKPRPMSRQP